MLDTFNKDVNSRNEHLLKNTQLKLRIPCIELIVLYNGIPLFPLFFYMTVLLDVFFCIFSFQFMIIHIVMLRSHGSLFYAKIYVQVCGTNSSQF